MFCLLSGEFPFRGKTTTEIFQSIMKGKVRFRGERWSNISKAGKDLIRKLLDPDPDTRINASGALMHKWFEEGALNADI